MQTLSGFKKAVGGWLGLAGPVRGVLVLGLIGLGTVLALREGESGSAKAGVADSQVVIPPVANRDLEDPWQRFPKSRAEIQAAIEAGHPNQAGELIHFTRAPWQYALDNQKFVVNLLRNGTGVMTRAALAAVCTNELGDDCTTGPLTSRSFHWWVWKTDRPSLSWFCWGFDDALGDEPACGPVKAGLSLTAPERYGVLDFGQESGLPVWTTMAPVANADP